MAVLVGGIVAIGLIKLNPTASGDHLPAFSRPVLFELRAFFLYFPCFLPIKPPLSLSPFRPPFSRLDGRTMMIPFIVYTAAFAAPADPQKLDEVLATWRAAEASTARRAEGGDKLNGFHFRSKIGEKRRGEEKKGRKRRPFSFWPSVLLREEGEEKIGAAACCFSQPHLPNALFPHLPLSPSLDLTCAAPKSHLIYGRRRTFFKESNLRSDPDLESKSLRLW